jgi:pimeloyl-ACP methyl ester carboxylesterase
VECQVKDIPIYYEVFGEGRSLVSLHGFTPDHRLMTGCMEPIFEQRSGWQRIYLDLPGMGKTPGPEWLTSSDQMLDVVLGFIDQVIPDQRFVLAGESYGGYLARGIIHHKPELVDGLLLICPLIVPDGEKRTLPPHVVLVRDEELVASLKPDEREEIESFVVVQTRDVWERTKDEVISGINVADQEFLTRLFTHGYSLSFNVDAVQLFEKPTLILFGRQDTSVGYRDGWDIIENYPRSTFAVLDRAGHNLQIEQAIMFNALVNEWLDRVEEPSNS